ncbi:MAG: UDP-N-acetylmuramoyl-L-alanyl-D-glutamate--2,6-diaminopimelate ligase [Bacilli bacterium]|nr:UDP-N-acetylmuramoyl-L-alanyl-D-glutamate--2,6-diaminopimelate ligase [Bacilli bacterium]
MINIKTDSRKVKKGDTFIAIKNVVRDGHDYINQAIKNGATRIICEHGSYPVETIIVDDTKKYLNEYLYENYYQKFKDIKLIGVTGTNGKTTICYLIFQILNLLGEKCAYIGTIGFYYGNVRRELNNTTPDTDLLYEMLLEAKENGCEYVAMEVSSHALDKNRVYGLEFDEVAFTNLTRDHLDYHKTIENYIEAKRKLFDKTRDNKIAVINADDKYFKEFINKKNTNILISQNEGDLLIKNIELSHLNTNITFEFKNKEYNTSINMIGKYNVYNFLTALLLVNQLGFNIEDILKLSNIINAPLGRMEKIIYKSNSIFIDYAHTPDAVINVLKSAEEFKKGKIISILGCGGDRDKTKRPLMGKAAEENSDYVIFTNDNPRTENEKQIMSDIIYGLNKDNHEIIFNREEAIKKGISLLNENDILMILGKGHEDYQIIGNKKIHFSDKEIVEKYIKS